MKTYKIPYEFYPFNMENLQPKMEEVEAESLNEAFEMVQEKYGSSVEIFKQPAIQHYGEF